MDMHLADGWLAWDGGRTPLPDYALLDEFRPWFENLFQKARAAAGDHPLFPLTPLYEPGRFDAGPMHALLAVFTAQRLGDRVPAGPVESPWLSRETARALTEATGNRLVFREGPPITRVPGRERLRASRETMGMIAALRGWRRINSSFRALRPETPSIVFFSLLNVNWRDGDPPESVFYGDVVRALRRLRPGWRAVHLCGVDSTSLFQQRRLHSIARGCSGDIMILDGHRRLREALSPVWFPQRRAARELAETLRPAFPHQPRLGELIAGQAQRYFRTAGGSLEMSHRVAARRAARALGAEPSLFVLSRDFYSLNVPLFAGIREAWPQANVAFVHFWGALRDVGWWWMPGHQEPDLYTFSGRDALRDFAGPHRFPFRTVVTGGHRSGPMDDLRATTDSGAETFFPLPINRAEAKRLLCLAAALEGQEMIVKEHPATPMNHGAWPRTIRWSNLPISDILHRAAVVVTNGQTGVALEALAAGVPVIVALQRERWPLSRLYPARECCWWAKDIEELRLAIAETRDQQRRIRKMAGARKFLVGYFDHVGRYDPVQRFTLALIEQAERGPSTAGDP